MGDTSDVHNANIELPHGVLKALGLGDSRMYILFNSAPRPWPDPQDAPAYSDLAIESNLLDVLSLLSRRGDCNDCLCLYTTGHGLREGSESALRLADSTLSDETLSVCLSAMPVAVTVVPMDRCCSGGFADTVARTGRNLLVTSGPARRASRTG